MTQFILEKLTVGIFGCNCYLIGSKVSNEIYIIDPGAQEKLIIEEIERIKANPIGIILTHAHPDHRGALRTIRNHFDIPLLYHKDEFNQNIEQRADRWLNDGEWLKVGDLELKVIKTAGHSPGGISLYSNDIRSFRGIQYDGVIFTGDLIFRRSVGRTDLVGGNKSLLFSNIRNKIIYNPSLSEKFLILAGHLGLTTIEEEKHLNPFGQFFLTQEDWKRNKYYNKDLKNILDTPIKDRV
jgi:glyoxylase-like metal-dependent hydrolase (beta-lactamase superfamily II)